MVIAGLTLGGGVGVLGRKFGLTCDNLLSAQVVVADGSVLNCDVSHNPDLFWALRGGGGGNFGLVTSLSFRTHQIAMLSLFTLNWPWSIAIDVIDAWQKWAPESPDELWSNCLLLATSDKDYGPIVRVNGVYVGDIGPLESLLQQLTSRIRATPISRYVSRNGLLESMMIEAGCYGMTVSECHLPSQDPHGRLQRVTSAAKSDYFTNVIPHYGIDMLVNAIARRQASSILKEGGIILDAFGGAINRVAPDATAFVHRNALFSAQYSANWNGSDPDTVVVANYSWLTNTWQAMRQYASGGAYQNYIDQELTDWQSAYYGTNLSRLQSVKTTYDSGNLFKFGQSIPPAP
jgi:FAD/FMN-containing dehydrogenase